MSRPRLFAVGSQPPPSPPAFSCEITIKVADLRPGTTGGVIQTFQAQETGDDAAEAVRKTCDTTAAFYQLFEDPGEQSSPNGA